MYRSDVIPKISSLFSSDSRSTKNTENGIFVKWCLMMVIYLFYCCRNIWHVSRRVCMLIITTLNAFSDCSWNVRHSASLSFKKRINVLQLSGVSVWAFKCVEVDLRSKISGPMIFVIRLQNATKFATPCIKICDGVSFFRDACVVEFCDPWLSVSHWLSSFSLVFVDSGSARTEYRFEDTNYFDFLISVRTGVFREVDNSRLWLVVDGRELFLLLLFLAIWLLTVLTGGTVLFDLESLLVDIAPLSNLSIKNHRVRRC